MKKCLIGLLALMLLCSSALAEARVDSVTALDGAIVLCNKANCYIQYDHGQYQFYNADGTAIGEPYDAINMFQEYLYFQYSVGSGLNRHGVLDCSGQVLTQPIYGVIRIRDDHWGLAYVLEPSTTDAYDFKNSTSQYIITRTDVLYDGQVIGSLTREEFRPSMPYGVVGKYFCVMNTEETGYYIDRHFNILHVNQGISSQEFTLDAKKGLFHNPTQQWAFCSTCTLTEEDVTFSVWYNSNTGCLVDLQGNVIKSGLTFDEVTNAGDYLTIRVNGKYGVMDKQGNIIIQPVYQEIPSEPFIGDYQAAITEDNLLHFIDRQGHVTAQSDVVYFNHDGASEGSRFAVVVPNRDSCIVMTATQGQLPTTYENYNTPSTGHQLLSVKKDGLWGAIDVDGNTVLPFIHTSLSMNDDSTLVLGELTDGTQYLYCLSYSEAAPAPTPAHDGSWVCSCGATNNSKFCTECGTARPVVEPQCTNCGYKPEGAAPKFCPECGTKFGTP